LDYSPDSVRRGCATVVTLVVGPSGCGKSSLVKAGLTPLVGQDPQWWILPAFSPGTDPLSTFIHRIVTASGPMGLAWPTE
jgi:predicted ATPase